MKKDDKTQALLENPALFSATLEEFAYKPYSLASTNEIIKKSNYNKGSFYYRFANKQELFVALMDYIFVIQIDIYNREKNISESSGNLEDLLLEIFKNLYLLYNENSLYYESVTKHLYDSDSLSIILNDCIEPLKVRLFRKFDTYRNIDNIDNIMILVDNLYQNFPKKLLESSDFDNDIRKFVKFILAEELETLKTSVSSHMIIKDLNFEDNPTYILVKDMNFEIPKNYISLSNEFFNFKMIRKKLFKLTNNYFLSYEGIVKKLINKSFKDVNYLLGFIDKDILRFINLNKEFKKLMLCSLYYALTEAPYIAFDLILKQFSQEETQLFYQHILPIMSKTSKIIVLNTEFSLSFPLRQIYILNSFNEIKAFDYSVLQTKFNNSFEIEYLKENIKHTKIIKSTEYNNFDFNLFFRDNKITSMRIIKEINYDTLRRNEDLI